MKLPTSVRFADAAPPEPEAPVAVTAADDAALAALYGDDDPPDEWEDGPGDAGPVERRARPVGSGR